MKPQEGERAERGACDRHRGAVCDDVDDALAFLSSNHAMLGGMQPIKLALTELGARRVETLLWSLFDGVAA